MMHKLLVLAALLLLTMPVFAAAETYRPHTRWNDQLDVCFYYHKINGTKAGHCYVPDEYCKIELYKPNWYREVPVDKCTWQLPRRIIAPPVNHKPVLAPLSPIFILEGETARITPNCTDIDRQPLNITYRGVEGPEWHTGYDDAGVHEATVLCADPLGAKAIAHVSITVMDANRPPFFKSPA